MPESLPTNPQPGDTGHVADHATVHQALQNFTNCTWQVTPTSDVVPELVWSFEQRGMSWLFSTDGIYPAGTQRLVLWTVEAFDLTDVDVVRLPYLHLCSEIDGFFDEYTESYLQFYTMPQATTDPNDPLATAHYIGATYGRIRYTDFDRFVPMACHRIIDVSALTGFHHIGISHNVNMNMQTWVNSIQLLSFDLKGAGAQAEGMAIMNTFDPGGVLGGVTAITGHGQSTAVGQGSEASGFDAVAVGPRASAAQWGATAIGSETEATWASAIAAGHRSKATAGNAIAIGEQTQASASSATAVGSQAAATAQNATAIGWQAVANEANTVVLGRTTDNVKARGEHVVSSPTIKHIVRLTQAEYDALTPSDDTLYVIVADPVP